jgi:hypothetical protein
LALLVILQDYKLDQIVTGVKWLIDGWSIEATARVLRNIFEDWLPELAAFAIAKIGSSWYVANYTKLMRIKLDVFLNN